MQYFPYYLATPGHDPIRMRIEGPISEENAVQRFHVERSDVAGDYWALTGALPAPASFAVYFDEVWLGTDTRSKLPCRGTFRRVVTTKAEGAQLQNERGPAGPFPLVSLAQPVSTETLTPIDVPGAILIRELDRDLPVQSVVHFRATPFRPLPEADMIKTLDTRRGFDIAVTTAGPDPANLHYRYVMGRADDGGFVFERFAWSVGDAVAETKIVRSRRLPQADGSYQVKLEVGYGRAVTLRMKELGNGLIQIVDAMRQ